MADKGDKLGPAVGFATLKPTFPDASAQLVEVMRATLRHAQEITAAVGEAEGAAERARGAAKMVDSLTTAAERRVVDSEIERLTSWLNRPAPSVETYLEKFRNVTYPSVVSPSAVSSTTSPEKGPTSPPVTSIGTSAFAATGAADDGASHSHVGGAASTSGVENGGPASLGAAGGSTATSPSNRVAPGRSSGKTITAEMSEEIETTVMWVQQLLEAVHFVESNEVLEPGASLLSIVQPGRRHQKELALTQSVNLFHEKKEEEEDAEDDTAVFRSQALLAVASQRSNISRE